jgi:hypothetical protein
MEHLLRALHIADDHFFEGEPKLWQLLPLG